LDIKVNPNTQEVYGAQFDLIYISSILNATKIESGPFLTQDGESSLVPIKKYNNSISKCEYAETRMGVENGITTPGILATITFKADANGTVPLTLLNVGLANPEAAPIEGIESNNDLVVTSNSPHSIQIVTWINVSNVVQPTSTPTPTPTQTYNNNGGGGGGGGAVASGEDFKNIELQETKYGSISAGKDSSFDFDNAGPITAISFTGKKNFGDISVKVEVLKSTSTLINESAPGTIYKNLNLWVGTSSFAKSESIENPAIKFRVENSWISSNGFDPSDVALLMWDTDSWKSLITNKVAGDETFTSFEAKADHFSSFAISAQKSPSVANKTPEVKITSSPASSNETPASTPVKGSPGFGVIIAGLMLIISCIIAQKK
jgi:PGF-pre-PGF domain-containing protein